jgi:hypothetical protein
MSSPAQTPKNTAASSELASLVPPPAARKAAPARGLPPSRIELNRQRSTLGNAWEGYQRTFIRTGSFMPIFHVLGGLAMLQCTLWAVNGMPDEVRCAAPPLLWLQQRLLQQRLLPPLLLWRLLPPLLPPPPLLPLLPPPPPPLADQFICLACSPCGRYGACTRATRRFGPADRAPPIPHRMPRSDDGRRWSVAVTQRYCVGCAPGRVCATPLCLQATVREEICDIERRVLQ